MATKQSSPRQPIGDEENLHEERARLDADDERPRTQSSPASPIFGTTSSPVSSAWIPSNAIHPPVQTERTTIIHRKAVLSRELGDQCYLNEARQAVGRGGDRDFALGSHYIRPSRFPLWFDSVLQN
jgi:hypothetical protein